MKFTSNYIVTLTNVLFVLEFTKNLVSAGMLNEFRFKSVTKSDKFVLSKELIFVGEGYYYNAMFKLNVMLINKNNNKSITKFSYLFSSILWHNCFGHVNY